MRITDLFDKLGWEYSQPTGGIDVYSLHGYHFYETHSLEWVMQKDGEVDFKEFYMLDYMKENLSKITRKIKLEQLLIDKK